MLKNVILSWLGGRPRLYDRNGTSVDAFNRFSTYIYRTGTTKIGKKTKENYSRYTAKLFDYLVESGLLDPDYPPTQQTLSDAVLMYPRFLIEGRYSDDPIISRIATVLRTEPAERESARTYIAGINLFLKVSHKLSRRIKKSEDMFAKINTIDLDAEYIGNERHRSSHEIKQITERGVIAANMPKAVNPTTSSAPLSISKGSSAKSREAKDFPYMHLEQVIDKCSPRNKCLMYMMTAGGLRFSEAIAAKKPLIDDNARKMRIEDPNNCRNSHNYSDNNKYAWKGRETAIIYFFEPLKSLFFNAYADYLAVRPTSDSDFLFLYEDNDRYGEPLIECSNLNNLNGTLNFQFKKAQQVYVLQTGVKPYEFSADYTLHSLRHFYGMWLRNRVRVPDRVSVGLELNEIQIMMGHKRLSSTEIYCRREAELIELDLELADYLIATRISSHNLALYAAEQYEQLAREIRNKVEMSFLSRERAE